MAVSARCSELDPSALSFPVALRVAVLLDRRAHALARALDRLPLDGEGVLLRPSLARPDLATSCPRVAVRRLVGRLTAAVGRVARGEIEQESSCDRK